jgi:hypothetical protein
VPIFLFEVKNMAIAKGNKIIANEINANLGTNFK